MTTKHTPGPWTIEEIEHTSTHSLFYVSSDDEEMIATCEDEANAYLIAAAPDLLAACERVVERWETHDGQMNRIDDVLAAIAKAKGETK